MTTEDLRFDRMGILLMTLGFTKSKVDSNLCFKVEGGRPVMLLLCVDALFLGMEVWTREVCSRDSEEV